MHEKTEKFQKPEADSGRVASLQRRSFSEKKDFREESEARLEKHKGDGRAYKSDFDKNVSHGKRFYVCSHEC